MNKDAIMKEFDDKVNRDIRAAYSNGTGWGYIVDICKSYILKVLEYLERKHKLELVEAREDELNDIVMLSSIDMGNYYHLSMRYINDRSLELKKERETLNG